MLAITTTAECASELCADRQFAGRIVVAPVNSRNSVTIADEEKAVSDLELILDNEDKSHRRLHVDKAYHSPQMQACVESYMALLEHCGITLQMPGSQQPIWFSSAYDKPVEPHTMALHGTYWADNMIQPV
ncbi:hypothetical protein BD289DRAFT_488462 [Coniella lustricola]|uniref:Malonyl-CoA:ACP transacylase (MAT) domain-containing protein n=1 Tax=Coniella lustricola TaxID=2025994 RepID=A0A2T3A3N4_9PEZI|nr:hypothetical protein BD289DRAFT_488462 [Coniella lustricola]